MDQDIAKSIAATLRHHGDEYHAQAVEKIASERDALKAEVSMLRGVGCDELDGDDVRGPCGACLKCARRERDDLAKRLRSAEKMPALARAYAEMMMDDRFNTEET